MSRFFWFANVLFRLSCNSPQVVISNGCNEIFMQSQRGLATKNSRTCRKLRKTMGAAVDAPCEILVCRRSRCAHMHNLLYCPQFAIQTGKTPE